jgi:TalC/MipB family fructose-6-phosphate aldolase
MELWLDTIDLDVIQNAHEMNILAGVTTNPTILSKADTSPETKIKQVLDAQSGYVAAQVTVNDFSEMLAQARRLAALSKRIIVKIPVTPDGLRAMAILNKENIATMATAIFEPPQVFLAAAVGAKYAAPYLGRIEKTTGHSFEILAEMTQIISQQKQTLRLLAAAITSTEQLIKCAALGVHAITLPAAVYQSLLATHPATEESLEGFAKDWLSGKYTTTSTLFN